jgi:hypothetical protein
MHFNSKNCPAVSITDRRDFTQRPSTHRRSEAGFILSLAEVLLSVVIVAIVFGTIINGYLAGAKRTEWTGCSLAAQSLGLQFLEQSRAAVWDASINKNEVTNLTLLSKSYDPSTKTWTGYMTNIMDIPWKGTNYVMATNYVTIQQIYQNNTTNVPVQMMVVRVDTVWPFTGWGNFTLRYYTNSICTFLAPDNRSI